MNKAHFFDKHKYIFAQNTGLIKVLSSNT